MPKTTSSTKILDQKPSFVQKGKFFLSRALDFVKRNLKRLLILVAILFVLIMIATQLTKKPVETPQIIAPKPLMVETMIVNGETAGVSTTGTIQNLGSVTLVAQTAGPVRTISTTEGKQVKKGTSLVSQETGYGTGNAAGVGVQIAQKSLEMAQTSYKNTQDSVGKARQIADESRTNTEELRKISEQSISDTQNLLNTTQEVIKKIQTDISANTDPNIIQGLRQQLVQYQSILAGNNSALRNLQYSVDTGKSPTKLADYSKDSVYTATQMQLDAARIGAEISELSLKSARIMASLNTVRAPFAGSIERIYVTQGQYLNPGTPVAKITGKTQLSLVVPVSGFTASQILDSGLIDVQLGTQTLQVPITHVPSTPTSGQLYEVLAVIPESYKTEVYEGQSISVTLPTIAKKTSNSTNTHRVPLESVFVTNLERYVFIYQDGKAVRKVVETGDVIGDQIEIKSGLNDGDQLILDRRVIDSQTVEPTLQEDEIQERG
ncbi:MAG: HlyD family efflux transporter periplasmic adaptor subunit [Patescibacteria group bacterium]